MNLLGQNRRSGWQTALLSALILFPVAIRHLFFWGGALAPILHLAEALGFFAWLSLILLRPRITSLRESIGLLAVMVLVPAFLSEDLGIYIIRGRELAVHFTNPYAHPPEDLATQDPLMALAKGWGKNPNPYGPIALLLAAGAAWLSNLVSALLPKGANSSLLALLPGALLFKAALMGTLIQAGRLLERHGGTALMLAFLLNPFVLTEALLSGHNDALLVLPLLATVLALRKDAFFQASLLLWMGVLIKFTPLALLPLLFAAALRKKRLGPTLWGNLVGVLLFGLCWLVFWRETGLAFLTQQAEIEGASLQHLLGLILGLPVDLIFRRIFMGIGVLYALFEARRVFRGEAFAWAAARTMAFVVGLGLSFPNLWYAFWWIPFLLLAPPTGTLSAEKEEEEAKRLLPLRVLGVLGPLSYVVYLSTRTLGPVHQWTQWAMGIFIPSVCVLLPGCVQPRGPRPSK